MMIVKIKNTDGESWFMFGGINTFKYGTSNSARKKDSFVNKVYIPYNKEYQTDRSKYEVPPEYENHLCIYESYDKSISYSFKPDYCLVNAEVQEYHFEHETDLYLNWIHIEDGSNLWFVFNNEAYICSDDGKTVDVIR